MYGQLADVVRNNYPRLWVAAGRHIPASSGVREAGRMMAKKIGFKKTRGFEPIIPVLHEMEEFLTAKNNPKER